jgi:hypothetical protein
MTIVELYSPGLADLSFAPTAVETHEDREAFLAPRSASSENTWRPPFVKVIEQDEHGRDLLQTEVLTLLSGYLVFRRSAVTTVAPIVDPYGSFLPINTSSGQRWAFLPKNYVDGLDEEQSGATYFAGSDRIKGFSSIIVDSREVAQIGVFRLARIPRGPVLYRADVKDSLIATGLFDGLAFRHRGQATF